MPRTGSFESAASPMNTPTFAGTKRPGAAAVAGAAAALLAAPGLPFPRVPAIPAHERPLADLPFPPSPRRPAHLEAHGREAL